MFGDVHRYRFRKEVVLRKDTDAGRRRDSWVVVAVYFVMLRKWSEVLRHWVIWHGCVVKELCWWCVRSQLDIRMVHQVMRNGSMVVDRLYIKRGCCMLGDFLLLSHYSFSCIAKQVTTLKQVWFCIVLTHSIQTLSALFQLRYHIIVTNITYTRTCPLP